MDPAYVYRVYRSQSGLLVRKLPGTGGSTGEGPLTIEINKPCAGSPGLLDRASRHAVALYRRFGD
jgi:hypothetical protein